MIVLERALCGALTMELLRRDHHQRPALAGAVNPALTAIANALRVGDHLLARLA